MLGGWGEAIIYKGTIVTISRFLSRNSTGQEREEWHIQNISKIKPASQEFSILQLSFRYEEEIKAFPGKNYLWDILHSFSSFSSSNSVCNFSLTYISIQMLNFQWKYEICIKISEKLELQKYIHILMFF